MIERWARSAIACWLVAGAAWVLCACEEGPPADLGASSGGLQVDPSCPRDLPSSCPSPPPSWSATIQGIIEERCYACHGPGGVEQPSFDYTTYQGVFVNRGPMLTQVYACAMPPLDAGTGTLTAGERAALLTWLVCDAPDN